MIRRISIVALAGLCAAGTLALAAPAAAAPVPLAQIGSTGAGAGQLNSPSKVALDGSGRLYIADTNNSRIDVFSSTGTFLRAFGWGVDTGAAAFEVCTTASTCQAGSSGGGAGSLSVPAGLAFDGSGNLYVADQGNHRISVFNTAVPSFIRAFGWGVATGASAFEVCTATCQAGGSGGGAGQLNAPFGLALDGAGNLYVGDASNNRISVFDTAGPSFTRAFGWGVNTGAGSFEVCTTASTCEAGIAGGGAGQLNIPYGVAVDGSGNLYTGDDADHRISVFDTAGSTFTRAFGWGVDTGASAFEVCTAASICQEGSSGGGAGQINLPFDVAVDTDHNLSVADGSNRRIEVFDTTAPSFTHAYGWGVDTGAAAFEVCTTVSTCQSGSAGTGAGQFGQPLGVATDCRGATWVADNFDDRITRFGEPGTPLPPCLPPPPPPPPPPGGGGGSTPPPAATASTPPSNAFTIGGKGRKLRVTVSAPGTVQVTAMKVLKPSSVSGGPGTIQVKLRLTKGATQKLRRKGRLKLRAAVTFTPTGGTPATQTTKRKVKR